MLSSDLPTFRKDIRAALTTVFGSGAEIHDSVGYCRELGRALADTGLFRLLVSHANGGYGYDLRHSLVMVEEMLSVATPGLGSSIVLQTNTLCPMLDRYGTKDIKIRFLEPIMNGTMIGSLGVTEPTGGSELVRAVQTRASAVSDDWEISGRKMFITNAPIADTVFVLARTSERPGAFGFSLFAVPTATPGFTMIERLRTFGLEASPVGVIGLDRCRVPKENVVGGIGKGLVQVFDIMREERMMVAAGAMFLARACVTTLAAELNCSGVPRLDVKAELSRFHVELDAALGFLQATAAEIAGRETSVLRTSIAKFRVVDRAQHIIARCLELVVEFAAERRWWFERAYRDSRVWSVYAGTSDTMRDIVGSKIAPESRRGAVA